MDSLRIKDPGRRVVDQRWDVGLAASENGARPLGSAGVERVSWLGWGSRCGLQVVNNGCE